MAVAAIVGVGPRIGSNLARAFAAEGFDIATLSRHPENHADVVKELDHRGTRVSSLALDATDPTVTKRVFAELTADLGAPEVVVYNPAVMPMYSFAQLTPEAVGEALPVMLYGAINTVQAVLPLMRERGSGTLIFTGGGFAVEPSVPRAPHSIAKAALRNYAHGLHLELKEEGIHAGTVTVHRPIEPGEDMKRCVATFLELYNEDPPSWSWEKEYGR